MEKEIYDKLVAENAQLKAQLEEQNNQEQNKQNQYEIVGITVTGSFTATVWGITPDYVYDDKTPAMAIITLFQSSPFMVRVGPEMASELVVGETYAFELKETRIDDIYKAEFDEYTLETVFTMYPIGIESFRTPREDEYGLGCSVNINVEEW